MAHRLFQNEPDGHTLQPTALIHEVWLVLQRGRTEFEDEGHYLALASRIMRHILIDHANSKKALRRGGHYRRVELDDADREVGTDVCQVDPLDLLGIDEALEKIRASSARGERLVAVVEMRFFAGLSVEQTASALHVDKATVKRDWRAAKALLSARLGHSREEPKAGS